ncbi:MAG: 30S ribosomal protein S5 [bacterium]|nr:30S ribosomal protein S5 [bacterium]
MEEEVKKDVPEVAPVTDLPAPEVKANAKPKTENRNTDKKAEAKPADGFRPLRKFNSRPGAPKDDFDSKLLDLARVTRVTGGGKRMSFRAVVVAGDKKGKIGIGIDKGKDVSQAIEKATSRAKKNMITVVIVDGTIPHQVEAKVGPAVVLLKPQSKGRGLVAGGAVRVICDLAGIKNVSSKILSGSKNKLNNARATMEALRKLKVR